MRSIIASSRVASGLAPISRRRPTSEAKRLPASPWRSTPPAEAEDTGRRPVAARVHLGAAARLAQGDLGSPSADIDVHDAGGFADRARASARTESREGGFERVARAPRGD